MERYPDIAILSSGRVHQYEVSNEHESLDFAGAIARLPRHYQRSAVVTRRSERVCMRDCARFGEFPLSDGGPPASKPGERARSLTDSAERRRTREVRQEGKQSATPPASSRDAVLYRDTVGPCWTRELVGRLNNHARKVAQTSEGLIALQSLGFVLASSTCNAATAGSVAKRHLRILIKRGVAIADRWIHFHTKPNL